MLKKNVELKNKTVLVTGAAGFIGSNLVLELLRTVEPIHIVGLDNFLDTNPAHYGLTGSPTQVERIFPPDNHVEHVVIEGENAGEQLHETLRKWKFAK